ncbi:Glycosyltransferase involved in cell wall bisynthesis [Lachnospiraceae bacterium C7]|nr:Glycosyltransferase involved in cell wall bisynthesis [Lachnospiraceae bacterium C7]
MRVCLILEGSYPYTNGGVSSWMNNYIKAMPDVEFVLWVIGAKSKNRGVYKYELAKNVTEVHEVFLDDALKIEAGHDTNYEFDEKQKEAIAQLMECGQPKWEELCYLFQDLKIKPGDFLMSEAFLDILTELCKEKYPYVAFADTFHTIRSMMIPIFYLLGTEVPKADIYHTICTGYGGLLGVLGHYKYNKPLILSEHGIYSREREEEIISAEWVQPTFKKQWIRFFYMLSDAVYKRAKYVTSLFTNARLTQIELGADPDSCIVISNGIQYDRFKDIPLKVENGIIDIGAVIRMAPIKDVKTMIYAFSELTHNMPNVRLHILGGIDDEEYNEECHDIIKKLGLVEGEDILFPGQVNVVKYMEQLDFTILTSISEGQPLSVLESMAARRPAVTTEVGCCRELLEGAPGDDLGIAGYLAPPMQREALAAAMLKMCKSRKLRLEMGEIGQRRVDLYYRHPKMIEAYKKLYE